MYVDLVMALNFVVDLLLLIGTNSLTGFPYDLRRTVPAALLGGIYSGTCFIRGLQFLGNGLWRTVVLAAMALIAYGWGGSGVKRAWIFLLLSLALSGILVSTGKYGFAPAGICAGLICVICTFAKGTVPRGKRYSIIRIRSNDREYCLHALHDTGNSLTDPITGEPVIVISASAAMRVLGFEKEELKEPLETIQKRKEKNCRLIPYSSVGKEGGLLLAVSIPEVEAEGKRGKRLIAMAPGDFRGFDALLGGD